MTDAVRSAGFFTAHLAEADREVYAAVQNELIRQRSNIELIASENITSLAVLEATGSVFTNKYAEGYPGKRYYGGCEFVDVAEQLAIDRAKKLFGCGFATVFDRHVVFRWVYDAPFNKRIHHHIFLFFCQKTYGLLVNG